MALTIIIGAIIGARTADRTPSITSAPAPLELLSMRHQRQGTTLTVSGLVRNPGKAQPSTVSPRSSSRSTVPARLSPVGVRPLISARLRRATNRRSS